MRFSLRKCIVFSAFLAAALVWSCDKHELGEAPEVQREKVEGANKAEPGDTPSVSPTPAAKPTPAEFFPENSPH